MSARSLHNLPPTFICYPSKNIGGIVSFRELDRFLLIDVRHANRTINQDQAVLLLGLKINTIRKRNKIIELRWQEPFRDKLPRSIKRLMIFDPNLQRHGYHKGYNC
jgi:hypothetical protein